MSNERFFQMMMAAMTLLLLVVAIEVKADTVLRAQIDSNSLVESKDQQGRPLLTYDLLAEIKRQLPDTESIEIKSVHLETKASMGGALLSLVVSSDGVDRTVDNKRLEGGSEPLTNQKGFQTVELKNSERRIQDAKLVGLYPVRMRNIRIVLADSSKTIAEAPTAPPTRSLPQPVEMETPEPIDVFPPAKNYGENYSENRGSSSRGDFSGGRSLDPRNPSFWEGMDKEEPEEEITSETPAEAPSVSVTPPPTGPVLSAPVVPDSSCFAGFCIGNQVGHRRNQWIGRVTAVNPRFIQVFFGDEDEGIELQVQPRDLMLLGR